MIRAVGIDVVDLDRFEKTVARWGDRFIHKILTPHEIACCHHKASAISSMAVRFAAKEAFIKCLSEDEYQYFRWQQIEILNADTGKPYIDLKGTLKNHFAAYSIMTTLTHSRHTAVAVVIIQ